MGAPTVQAAQTRQGYRAPRLRVSRNQAPTQLVGLVGVVVAVGEPESAQVTAPSK